MSGGSDPGRTSLVMLIIARAVPLARARLRAVFIRLAHDLEADLLKEVTHETPLERSPPTHPRRRRSPRGLSPTTRRPVLRQCLDHHPTSPTPPRDRGVRPQAPRRRDRADT